MRVPGITILAGKLATPVRINGPGERHASNRAAIEQGPHGQREIFHIVSLAKGFALGCEARDADELGAGQIDQGQGSHHLFAFYSLYPG